MKLNLIRKLIDVDDLGTAAFFPMYNSDRESVKRIPCGEIRKCEVKKSRNTKYHNKFMAMLRLVVHNSEEWDNSEQLLYWIKAKLALGTFKEVDKRLIFVPDSVSFESMDQFKFEDEIYKPALPILANEIKVSVDDLETNYGEFM